MLKDTTTDVLLTGQDGGELHLSGWLHTSTQLSSIPGAGKGKNNIEKRHT